MKRWGRAMYVVGLCLLVAAGWRLVHPTLERREALRPPRSSADPAVPPAVPTAQGAVPARGPVGMPPGVSPLLVPSPTGGGTLLDPSARERMRQLIWNAFAQAPPSGSRSGPAASAGRLAQLPALAGQLDRGVVRERMHADFIPMATGCYAEAAKRFPGLSGAIVLRFTVVGDDAVGGIVESADVGPRSTIDDPTMVDCLVQSMLSMTFPPPQQGGFVTIDYPIDFNPEEEG